MKIFRFVCGLSIQFLAVIAFWPKWWLCRLSGVDLTNVHLGCGKNKFSGWINADIVPSADLIIFLGWRMPFASNTVLRVYSEHVMEHVTLEVARFHAREVFRVLKSGGVFRIAMPDLDDIVDCYKEDWRKAEWVNWSEFSFVSSGAEAINMAFRGWGHQYLYNRSEIERVLRAAGFRDVVFCSHGESKDPLLTGLETRGDSKLIVEAWKI